MAQRLAAGGALGWHSETLTRHLRAATARETRYEIRDTSEESAPNSYFVSRISSLIRVYPDLALAMLRHKAAAAGRVWLLLRGLDAAGTGRLPVAGAAQWLTAADSPAHICGRRQLANLLKAGDGLYWQRDRGRDGAEYLRLASTGRVAAALGVRRLGGRPVGVPVSALTGTIGQARAQLYAAFHSGRTQTDFLSGQRRARGPIARETLCKLSGASRNSQRAYERRAGVARRAAFALGPQVGAADEHEAAWQRGRALFHYRDAAGRYGRPGALYLAWQLPNEYTGPHDSLSRGRQKRLNRALADLFRNGMTGNGERVESGGWRAAGGAGVQGGRGAGEKGSASGTAAESRRDAGAPLRPVESSFSHADGCGGGRAAGAEGAAADGRRDGGDPAVPLLPCSPAPRPPSRRFYTSAKAAYLARHDGEKYWRQGQMWLITNYELGITNEERAGRAKGSSFVIRHS